MRTEVGGGLGGVHRTSTVLFVELNTQFLREEL